MNTFGRYFRLTTFGESHGPAIGGVIDGCPSGLHIDHAFLHRVLARRQGGSSPFSTSRREPEEVEWLSGLLDGVTTGTPLAFLIRNKSAESGDYDHLRDLYRPSHADYTYEVRYGIRDHRGGGRASARETVARVVAGAVAMQLLEQRGIHILSYTSALGGLQADQKYDEMVTSLEVEHSQVGCPYPDLEQQMIQSLQAARVAGDSLGGVVSTIITGVPAGLGTPLFAKLDADLARAMMSIGAAKGFEMGDGFDMCQKRGSEVSDSYLWHEGEVVMCSNHSGGTLGGISDGAPICFRTAFKPISSIQQPQPTITRTGESTTFRVGGRHDISVFPRVLPIVDAMAALTLLDALLGS